MSGELEKLKEWKEDIKTILLSNQFNKRSRLQKQLMILSRIEKDMEEKQLLNIVTDLLKM